jgi:hypothetical protein
MCARHVNYYETLGIPRNASQQDIARAFKKVFWLVLLCGNHLQRWHGILTAHPRSWP